MTSNFELLATYNQWMNKRIIDGCGQLTAEQIARDRGTFFTSILGTLNHILVGDILWLKRFASHDEAFHSLNYVRDLEQPSSLDMIIHSNLRLFIPARTAMDEVIVQFSSELSEQTIARSLSYTNRLNQPFRKKLSALLLHFFNHQTHHRGQLTTLLYQAGVDVGDTDLVLAIADE